MHQNLSTMITFLLVVLKMVKCYSSRIIKIHHQLQSIRIFKVKSCKSSSSSSLFDHFWIDLHLDWSYPGEILAIGGHRCLNDISYINEIIFYSRRGEFLHRINIPQTVWKENIPQSNYANIFLSRFNPYRHYVGHMAMVSTKNFLSYTFKFFFMIRNPFCCMWFIGIYNLDWT